eukprot:4757266-Pyramimonas_sp.AAC.1
MEVVQSVWCNVCGAIQVVRNYCGVVDVAQSRWYNTCCDVVIYVVQYMWCNQRGAIHLWNS